MYQFGNIYSSRYERLGGSIGDQVTAHASADTKGSWITAVTTTFTYEYLIVEFPEFTTAADMTIDLGINDGSGNIFIIAADLRHHCREATTEFCAAYGLPLHIPSGAQLTARCQCSTGGAVNRISWHGFSQGLYGVPGFSKCIALYTPTTSRGISCDPGATPHAKTRTQLTASSSDHIRAIMIHAGPAADTARVVAKWLIDVEAGASGLERVLVSNLPIIADATMDVPGTQSTMPFPCDVPAGERFSINLQSDSATAGDRVLDIGAWGFVQ